jgi:hypothetical protein
MQTITTIGLDIAKSVFQVHGVDAGGQVVIRRQLKRRSVLAFARAPDAAPADPVAPRSWSPRTSSSGAGAARIVAHDVGRVLADIDADHGDRGIGGLRHGVLLVFGAPCQLRLLAGQEHGRTIPLPEIGPEEWCFWSCPIPAIHPAPDIRRSSGGSDASRVNQAVRGDVVDLAARSTDIH